MKNTGSMLKAKRESSNLSLSEVALATKINPKVLAAIESGEDKGLPAKTILKGFVRSYAMFLRMDVEEVMRSFQEETAPPPPATSAQNERVETAAPASRRRVDEESSSSGLRTAAVVVIVLLIGLIIGVRELMEKYQRERVVEQPVNLKASPLTTPPVTPVPTPAPTEKAADTKAAEESKPGEIKTVEPKAEEKAEAKAETKTETKTAEAKPEEPKAEEAKPVETKPVAPAVAEAPTQRSLRDMDLSRPPRNLVEVEPNSVSAVVAHDLKEKPAEPAAATAADAAKPAEPNAATASTPTSATLKAVKNEIILEALDKVEVKFEVKGETKKVSLAPTQVHTIRSDQPLTIDLSDGGAVNVILNGRERGPAGDLGKPKTITIP